jgi:hypothetical protein
VKRSRLRRRRRRRRGRRGDDTQSARTTVTDAMIYNLRVSWFIYLFRFAFKPFSKFFWTSWNFYLVLSCYYLY